MPSKPEHDEVVRLLDSAYETSRLPAHTGAEFLAEVHARALSVWLVRLAVALGLAIALAAGTVAYLAVTRVPEPSRQTAPLDDPGPASAPLGVQNRNRMLNELSRPQTTLRPTSSPTAGV